MTMNLGEISSVIWNSLKGIKRNTTVVTALGRWCRGSLRMRKRREAVSAQIPAQQCR